MPLSLAYPQVVGRGRSQGKAQHFGAGPGLLTWEARRPCPDFVVEVRQIHAWIEDPSLEGALKVP